MGQWSSELRKYENNTDTSIYMFTKIIQKYLEILNLFKEISIVFKILLKSPL